jgi:F-type H+-transporting ATPase subunit delta
MLANRYAAAWVAAAGPSGLALLAQEVAALQTSLANDAQLLSLLNDPVLPRGVMADALLTVARKAGFSAITAQFLSVLANAGRKALLPKVLSAAQTFIDKAQGIQKAKLKSAVPLPANTIKTLQEALSKTLNSNVHLVTEMDENLLGGIQVEMNSWLVDASLAGHLGRLEVELKSTPQQAA